jgi:hypothetical protein
MIVTYLQELSGRPEITVDHGDLTEFTAKVSRDRPPRSHDEQTSFGRPSPIITDTLAGEGLQSQGNHSLDQLKMASIVLVIGSCRDPGLKAVT